METPRSRGGEAWWVAPAVLIGVVLAGHGLSLWHGLVFDDHTHRHVLRNAGWALGELVHAARVGEANGLIRFWWAHEPTFWQPFRPFCFLVMKIEYVLVGWRPMGMHVFCLGWHVLCAWLVRALALRFQGDARWALAAAVIFALHPGHATTCQWIASSNEVMATTFVLAAVLAYARWARWPLAMVPGVEGDQAIRKDRTSTGWLVLCYLAYGAGLGCRETAVLVPVLVLLIDVLVGGASWRRRGPAYAVFVALTVTYLWLRHRTLGGLPMPGLPYMYPPDDPGFFRVVFDKLLFYQLGLFLYVPALQLGSFEYLSEHPLLLYGLSAGLVVVLGVTITRAVGLSRPVIVLLFWPILCVVPVLPVFAGSHHLYLASVGSSILLTGVVRGFGRVGRSGVWARARVPILAAGLVGYVSGTVVTGVQFHRLARAEHRRTGELVAAVGPAGRGDRVFVVDYPVLASFAGPAVAEATGAGQLTIWALSVRTGDSRPAHFETLGPSSVLLRVPSRTAGTGTTGGEAPYFVRMAERQIRLLIPAAAGPEAHVVGTQFTREGFRATLLGCTDEGQLTWRIDFDEPLSAAGWRLCVPSDEGGFVRLRPDGDRPSGGATAQRSAPANG